MDPQTSLIVNCVTASLLLISEILALSKCDSNGIVDFLVKLLKCLNMAQATLKVFYFLIF